MKIILYINHTEFLTKLVAVSALMIDDSGLISKRWEETLAGSLFRRGMQNKDTHGRAIFNSDDYATVSNYGKFGATDGTVLSSSSRGLFCINFSRSYTRRVALSARDTVSWSLTGLCRRKED